MARSIDEIKESITANLKTKLTLSGSKVAEWQLWAWAVAVALHTFEVIIDKFRAEIETITNELRPGTLKWYTEQCYRFQNGHELRFDENTALLGYVTDDPASRIVAIASVGEVGGSVIFRVAKSDKGTIVPLSELERLNFKNYIDAIKFAGTKTGVVSTTEDKIRYRADVYYDPVYPSSMVEQRVAEALAAFKLEQVFGGVIYSQRFVDAVMAAPGVITAKLHAISRKGASDTDFVPIDVSATLEAGYFNYADDSVLIFKSIKDLQL